MKPESKSAAAQMSFEEALKRLEEVVERLERGDEPLEGSLALFEEGVRLSGLLTSRLEEAEARIERITGTGDGGARLEPETAAEAATGQPGGSEDAS